MISATDISSFMTWWVTQVITIFTYVYGTLDNIQFAGTSVLRVIIWIIILGGLFRVTLTIPRGLTRAKSERRKETKNDNESK